MKERASLLVTPSACSPLTLTEALMETDHDGRLVVGIDLRRRRKAIMRMTEACERMEAVRI